MAHVVTFISCTLGHYNMYGSVKMIHRVYKNGVLAAEVDPAVKSIFAVLFGTAYSLSATDAVTGASITISNEKPSAFYLGLGYTAETPYCSHADTTIGATVVYETIPSVAEHDRGYTLKMTFQPTSAVQFNVVYVVAHYPDGKRVLVYRGCHSTPITVSADEALSVEVVFSV